MTDAKEGWLNQLDSAYQRLIISSGDHETESFTKAFTEESKVNRRVRIAEFMRAYQESSLFIRYDSLSPYYDMKMILNIILSDLEETEFYLYLFVPQCEISAIREELEIVYNYRKDWITYALDFFEDDGYVIEILDNRYTNYSINNYLRIYPDRKGYLITDSDFHIKKTTFLVSEDICRELFSEAKKRVKKTINDECGFTIDEREFLKSFVVTYGVKWLGYQSEWWMDYKDYFLKKIPSQIIEKVMNIPIINEKFVNAGIPSGAVEKVEDDI